MVYTTVAGPVTRTFSKKKLLTGYDLTHTPMLGFPLSGYTGAQADICMVIPFTGTTSDGNVGPKQSGDPNQRRSNMFYCEYVLQ